ncbi:hypothetical protein SKAU_G00123520 [Synaphobranchus kaupii]|uniref:Uncharacterized protein n=1 Tax=Synaphobranchus kaupii TaxID=118154 RepID=A0A9Q1FNZ9_SYNKA|nr:hypothetical protein SKAU_G00123520 [Synaphobranchus kaupii]
MRTERPQNIWIYIPCTTRFARRSAGRPEPSLDVAVYLKNNRQDEAYGERRPALLSRPGAHARIAASLSETLNLYALNVTGLTSANRRPGTAGVGGCARLRGDSHRKQLRSERTSHRKKTTCALGPKPLALVRCRLALSP